MPFSISSIVKSNENELPVNNNNRMTPSENVNIIFFISPPSPPGLWPDFRT